MYVTCRSEGKHEHLRRFPGKSSSFGSRPGQTLTRYWHPIHKLSGDPVSWHNCIALAGFWDRRWMFGAVAANTVA